MQVAESKRKLPHLVTALPGPKAKQIVERDHNVVSPSYTRDYPLVAKTGRGAVVEDVDGNTFLDFAAGIAVVATGHCHPQVVAAIQKQAAELIHMSCTDFYYEGTVELAEKLASIAPGKSAKRVYFGNSGTEAVEAAMKLARYHTKRDKFIAFHGCFHGRTIRLAFTHGEQSRSAEKFRLAARRSVSCAVSEHVSRRLRRASGKRRGRCLGVHRERTFQAALRSRGCGRDFRRADSGRGRISRRRRRNFCRVSSASAASTEFCWSPTKCSREWAARANGGPWTTPASSRTLSARRRESHRACRSAP